MSAIALPNYESPPVVETILGVQFDPLEKLTAPLLGVFWSTIRDEWPNAAEAPYLESKSERFEADHWWSQLRFQVREGHPPVRLQFRNRTSDRMIQVQNSRLHVNWMGYEGSQYPRYQAVRGIFEDTWKRFTSFVAREDLGELSPNQWEVTYINHIPRGAIWQNPSDWGFMRLIGDTSVLDGLAAFAGFQGGWRFDLPDHSGRLHVSWTAGQRRHPENSAERQEIIIVEQTARGPFAEGKVADEVLDRLDAGHQIIVRAFTQIMDDRANQFWGYQP